MRIGFLLGAGASYEVGMPLVQEFSSTLRLNILKRLDTKLFNFDGNDEIKKHFIDLLNNESLNYEEVVGELEKTYLLNSIGYGILIQLVESIQLLLLEDQMLCMKLFEQKVKDYYGLKKLINDEKIIDVFTLNHDIIFEEICDYYKIPYRDGFFTSTTSYDHIANFKTLTAEQLDEKKLNFFEEGEFGVNLIKLHGSFDIFAAEDKNLFLKCYGDGSFLGSNVDEIKKIENHNMMICTKDKIRCTNELCVYDKNHVMQFLRRSLLSGAHKFQNKFEQIAPKAFLEVFKIKLNNTTKLIVIGYSFGDLHINEQIKVWLSKENSTLSIYDPYRTDIPDFLLDYQERISIIQGGFTDFCLSVDSSMESLETHLLRDNMFQIRENLKMKRLKAELK